MIDKENLVYPNRRTFNKVHMNYLPILAQKLGMYRGYQRKGDIIKPQN